MAGSPQSADIGVGAVGPRTISQSLHAPEHDFESPSFARALAMCHRSEANHDHQRCPHGRTRVQPLAVPDWSESAAGGAICSRQIADISSRESRASCSRVYFTLTFL